MTDIHSSSRSSGRALGALVLLTAVLVAFVTGLFLGRQQGQRLAVPPGEGRVLNQGTGSSHAGEDVDFGLFWDVWNLVKENYYRQPVSDKSLFYGAMQGMLASLDDPYSLFFDPDKAEEFSQDLAGSFEGIGAEIGMKDDQLQIVAPLPGSPAEQAGLLPGDKIFFIDGKETASMTIDEAVGAIRGPHGTAVVLTIGRDGATETKDISIVRDTITVDSVRLQMRDDGIAVIDVYLFNDDTTPLFTKAVNDALAGGAKGIVLDMRSDPGGLLTAAIDVASAWVGPQPMVIQRVRGEDQVLFGSGAARLKGVPTVVLVNGGSASGSEIVAGALQDYGVVTLVGEQTFGKGSVQDYQELKDGSAVKMTVAEWLTPKGHSINHVGIPPDVVVAFTQEDAVAGRDPQMDKALEILHASLQPAVGGN